MISLVGYTGFVGSNLYAVGKETIDRVYNSKNIEEAYGTAPDLLIYSGMRAEKYLANTNPEADRRLVYQAEENIRNIAPKHLVLISTIDVFQNSDGKYEEAMIHTGNLQAYGLNRYILEQWVTEKYPKVLIIRLPGLYGLNIKKNFIYDYINVIPYMLKAEKFEELAAKDKDLQKYYLWQPNGFYKRVDLADDDRELLKEKFKILDFTALNFTDSRNIYQFYPLERLWGDIQIALRNNLHMWHAATEPVSAAEIYKYLTGKDFINEVAEKPVVYDYRTRYADVFGGSSDYIMSKEEVLKDIRRFVGGA